MDSGRVGAKAERATRARRGVWLAAASLWLGCASGPVECEPPRPWSAPGLPERGISAHRGGRLGCPENTLGAFERAICRGVHQIELDVRATVDAGLVVAHDDRVKGEQGRALRISESTLAEVRELRLARCAGETDWQHVPTLREALAIMPRNVWINLDIKESDPLLAALAAQEVAEAQRFDQTIFGSRGEAGLAVRRIAGEAGARAWVANMNRQILRCQYVDDSIDSCAAFLQLFYLRGKPGRETIDVLKEAGLRVNYSWLDQSEESELRRELEPLLDAGVDYVLVDHVGPAMDAACTLGIPPQAPLWNGPPPFACPEPPPCVPVPALRPSSLPLSNDGRLPASGASSQVVSSSPERAVGSSSSMP